jgi:hypothetical protein
MKRIGLFLSFTLAAGFDGQAQVLTPAGPALPSSAPAPVLSPDGNVAFPGPVMLPPSPTGNTAATTTPPPVAPANTADLANVLLNLRFVIDRALPRLAAYNIAAAAAVSGTNIDNSAANGALTPGASGANLGANMSQNLSGVTGANLSANLSSVVGVSPSSGGQAVPITTPSSAGAGFAIVQPPVNATITTNGVVVPSALTDQETVNALEVLQQDLTHAQTILTLLNVSPGVSPQLPPTGR